MPAAIRDRRCSRPRIAAAKLLNGRPVCLGMSRTPRPTAALPHPCHQSDGLRLRVAGAAHDRSTHKLKPASVVASRTSATNGPNSRHVIELDDEVANFYERSMFSLSRPSRKFGRPVFRLQGYTPQWRITATA